MGAVVVAGIDVGNSYHVPFAAVEFVLFGLPAGLVFGTAVFALVSLTWVVARRYLSPQGQRLTSAGVALVSSGLLFYTVFSFFPVSFSLGLFAAAVALCFGTSYLVQALRKMPDRPYSR